MIPLQVENHLNEYAVTKNHIIHKVPVSVQLDQISMISQASIQSPLTHYKVHSEVGLLSDSSKNCFTKSNGESSTHMNIKNWKEVNEVSEHDELGPSDGSLIFLIRRVNRRTNKSVLLTKHRKLITKCSHKDQEYYAKGM